MHSPTHIRRRTQNRGGVEDGEARGEKKRGRVKRVGDDD